MRTVIKGLTAARQEREILVNDDGSLAVGLTVDGGDITLGTVGIDQVTPGANGVVVESSALPTGAASESTLAAIETLLADPATSAKQDTGNSTLSTINGKITACNTGAVTVAASALPTGAATAAKQPALGTAGTASADVLTVQGIANGVAQPVSGTVTALQQASTTDASTALEASRVIKNSAGTLYALTVINKGPAQSIQLADSATLPANGTSPVWGTDVPANSTVDFTWPHGKRFATGIIVYNSSTYPTKTIGSADCLFYSDKA